MQAQLSFMTLSQNQTAGFTPGIFFAAPTCIACRVEMWIACPNCQNAPRSFIQIAKNRVKFMERYVKISQNHQKSADKSLNSGGEPLPRSEQFPLRTAVY
jgi:hypothetical protein